MALDFGTGGGRCLLVSVDGKRQHRAHSEWAFEMPPETDPQRGSFEPDQAWGVLAAASRAAISKAGISAAQVIGVSTTSVRGGFVLLDPSGREIWTAGRQRLPPGPGVG